MPPVTRMGGGGEDAWCCLWGWLAAVLGEALGVMGRKMTCLGGSGSRSSISSSKGVASFVDTRVTRALQGRLPPSTTLLILFLTRLRAGPPCASWVHTRDISPLSASGMPLSGRADALGLLRGTHRAS